MKKIIALSAAALLIFVNASIWEGAVSTSISKDLPENGYFAATNSFPRFTMVTITNLENNMAVTVRVVSGLDNPGLLVTISRDAADAIGLQHESIGRVRMEESPEPIAYSEHSDWYTAFDAPGSGTAASTGTREPLPAERIPDTRVAETLAGAKEEVPAALTEAEARTYKERQEILAPRDIPEFSGRTPEDPVLAYIPEVLPDPDDPVKPGKLWERPADPLTPGTSIVSASPVDPKEDPKESVTQPDPSDLRDPSDPRDPTDTRDPSDLRPIVPEGRKELVLSDMPSYIDDPEAYEFALAPAEEKPPSGTIPVIDPNDILALISPGASRESTINPNDVIPSARPGTAASSAAVIDPAYVIDPIPQNRAAPASNAIISAPVISSLEKGKYYVQLAASREAELTEAELGKIRRQWPFIALAVQDRGSGEQFRYRILVGPVNLGESGALLQRFKVNYKDAFVRVGI